MHESSHHTKSNHRADPKKWILFILAWAITMGIFIAATNFSLSGVRRSLEAGIKNKMMADYNKMQPAEKEMLLRQYKEQFKGVLGR